MNVSVRSTASFLMLSVCLQSSRDVCICTGKGLLHQTPTAKQLIDWINVDIYVSICKSVNTGLALTLEAFALETFATEMLDSCGMSWGARIQEPGGTETGGFGAASRAPQHLRGFDSTGVAALGEGACHHVATAGWPWDLDPRSIEKKAVGGFNRWIALVVGRCVVPGLPPLIPRKCLSSHMSMGAFPSSFESLAFFCIQQPVARIYWSWQIHLGS